MQTLKIKYSFENPSDKVIILSYMREYSSCLHYLFNRINKDKWDRKQCYHKVKELNNISLMNSWFISSAYIEAKALVDSLKTTNTNKLIFRRKAFFERLKGKISREEYYTRKLNPIYFVGAALYKGNGAFKISQDLSYISFKPKKGINIQLNIPILKHKSNWRNILSKLYKLQEAKAIPITYKLDLEYIYISFDESNVFNEIEQRKQIQNRVLALDLNPNYIGWSIVDWKSETEFILIDSGIYSIKKLNDKDFALKNQSLNSSDPKRIYLKNKRQYEIYQISKDLINKAIHFQVSLISVEDLSIRSKKLLKGNISTSL